MSESSTHGQLWWWLFIVVLWKRISGLQGPLLPSRLHPRMAPIAYISWHVISRIDQQIIASKIRVAMATEIDVQQCHVDQGRESEDFLRQKYTNVDLYAWLASTSRVRSSPSIGPPFPAKPTDLRSSRVSPSADRPAPAAPHARGGRRPVCSLWGSLRRGLSRALSAPRAVGGGHCSLCRGAIRFGECRASPVVLP